MNEVELREQIAQLLAMKHTYHTYNPNPVNWYGLSEQGQHDALADAGRILDLVKLAGYLQVEPVQLEVLGDKKMALAFYGDEDVGGFWHREGCKAVSQATIAHNEAKGQLYRRNR